MQGPYVFGDYELDEARFELRHGGAKVSIQPKALRLLLYLVRHRERVATSDELLGVLWRGETVGRGSLKRAVRGVRRALGDSGESQASIRTVRGLGYQFVLPLTPPRSPVELPWTYGLSTPSPVTLIQQHA